MADSKKTAVLIDANSLIHRAYHALPPFRSRKGEMVNAVYGFISIVLRAMKELHPEYIAAAFDMEGPTFRHEKYAEYKATRAKAPDELYQQFPLIKEALAAFHIPIYEKQGFEADDIIGTLAKKIAQQKKEAVETIVVSGDLDTLQLINEKTKVYTMRKGVQDSQIYDIAQVREKFGGLSPSQMVDYKGLRGDPSDNIPGVPGVGEKTATQLVGEFGSIENMYKVLKKNGADGFQAKQKLREKLLAEEKQALASKDLATIEQDVPISFSLESLSWRNYDQAEVEALLRRFGFDSLIKRVSSNGTSGEQTSMFEENDTIAEKVERYAEDGILSPELADVERKLTGILRAMEQTGVKIDKPYFQHLGSEMEKEIREVENKIHRHAKKEFNVSSTQQLSVVLFEELALSRKGLKKTPKGVISTASPELEKIQNEHPIVAAVLAHRELKKIYTTYVAPLPALTDKNGRLHTHFDQFGAATGRISSSEPNLQNIPNQGEWGEKIRKGFVSEKGFQLVSFDYSQMELRVAAHISRDRKMREFFEEGADIHQMTAAEVFNVEKSEVTKQMRFRAKALNFGVLYGMGARGFAVSAGISMAEAEDFIENYFARFPGIHEYMENMKEFARERGYVETMFGRKRYIPEINSTTPPLRAAAERMAVNHPIQGSVADIMKIAMVQVDEQIGVSKKKWRVLLQIHDELLFEIADGIVKKMSRSVKSLLENIRELEVPLRIDVKKGKNWADVEKIL